MSNDTAEKLTVLYITFVDFEKALSGSSVRPQNMYRAFLECGYDVKLLKGQQNRRRQRRQNVREVLNWLKTNHPDICYVEPPTGPFFNQIDHRLMSKVRKMGIPTGLFYRDAYWRYGLLNMGRGFVPKLKAHVIRWMQIRDLRYFRRNCDIVYVPSAGAGTAWGFFEEFKTVIPLLPGCNIAELQPKQTDELVAIYVGGVQERYGTYVLLDAFKAINEGNERINLKLVCREAEWQSLDNAYRTLENTDWLQVHHAQGEELAALYRESDFALCPLRTDFYNDLAMPIKLMEYIAFGKPIVATNCMEMKRFIEESGVGVITEYTVEDFARGVRLLAEDAEQRCHMTENCLIARQKNSWAQRAGQVARDLLDIRSGK